MRFPDYYKSPLMCVVPQQQYNSLYVAGSVMHANLFSFASAAPQVSHEAVDLTDFLPNSLLKRTEMPRILTGRQKQNKNKNKNKGPEKKV